MSYMQSADKPSQHVVAQSQAREARHVIPACSQDQSQVRKVRHAIPACTEQTCYPSMHCIKEAAKTKNSGHADTVGGQSSFHVQAKC